MTASGAPDRKVGSSGFRATILPGTAFGWSALAASAIAIASWVVLPMLTMTFRDAYPVTDTWVMPAIGTFLIDAAAVLNVLAVWRRHERSLLSMVVAVVTLALATLFTLFVAGGTIIGA